MEVAVLLAAGCFFSLSIVVMLVFTAMIVSMFRIMIVLLLTITSGFFDSGYILAIRSNTKTKQKRVNLSPCLGR